MKITGLFKNLYESSDVDNFIDFITNEKSKQLAIKEKAIEHAIDLIARTISKSEIQIYRYDSKKKKVEPKIDEYYYKLNIKPNNNEYGTSFFYRVVSKLLHDEEALIIEIDHNLYLADSFDSNTSILYPKTYSNITLIDVDGNTFPMDKSYKADEVIHLTLGGSRINEVLESYFGDFGKLLGISSSQYKSNNIPKWKLLTPGSQPAIYDRETKKEISYEEYKKKITDGLFDEEESIILLSEALKLEKINGDKPSTSEDYRNLERKWSDEVANAFNIPLDVFYGSKTDKSTGTNDFISFAVVPILRILEDGMNGTIIKKKEYLNGDRIYINKLNMKHFDIFDSANSLDKLFGDGFSHNDLRYFLDIPQVDEDWADEHNFTKNYGNVKDLSGKGGDE